MSINGARIKDPLLLEKAMTATIAVIGSLDTVADDREARKEFDYGWLPPKHQHLYSRSFFIAFAMTVAVVGKKIASKKKEKLRCVAEELALRAISHVTGDLLKPTPFFGAPDARLKGRRERLKRQMEDFESCALEDRDFEILFDEKMDGFERPDDPINERMGMVGLQLHEWFDSFHENDPKGAVDPAIRVLAEHWLAELKAKKGS